MDKKIFYNGDQAYHVVRTLHMSTFNPERYGVYTNDERAFMMILQYWRDSHNCDHVLRQGDYFMLCRTIKDVEIID